MVAVQDIVDVTVTVSTSAISRVGFNSLLILGKPGSFVDGTWGTLGARTIKAFTSLADALADTGIVSPSPVRTMLTAAFAQSPRVPTVYVANQLTASAATPSVDLAAYAALNNAWFGVCLETDTIAHIDDAAAWIPANKKYGFFRAVGKTTLTLPTYQSNYVSYWYNNPVTYLDVAAASALLARTPGSYIAAFKTLEGIAATTGVTAADEAILRAAGVNWYPSVAGRLITYNGTTSLGASYFIDTYIGALYLEQRMEEDVYAVLVSAEKIPYTDSGINLIVNAISSRLQQSISEGYLTNDPQPVITAPTALQVSAIDRAARLLPDVRFTAYTAGGIQKVIINGTIQV
jgi:hypothetical protein